MSVSHQGEGVEAKQSKTKKQKLCMAKDKVTKTNRIKASLSHATRTRQFFLLSENERF